MDHEYNYTSTMMISNKVSVRKQGLTEFKCDATKSSIPKQSYTRHFWGFWVKPLLSEAQIDSSEAVVSAVFKSEIVASAVRHRYYY